MLKKRLLLLRAGLPIVVLFCCLDFPFARRGRNEKEDPPICQALSMPGELQDVPPNVSSPNQSAVVSSETRGTNSGACGPSSGQQRPSDFRLLLNPRAPGVSFFDRPIGLLPFTVPFSSLDLSTSRRFDDRLFGFGQGNAPGSDPPMAYSFFFRTSRLQIAFAHQEPLTPAADLVRSRRAQSSSPRSGHR